MSRVCQVTGKKPSTGYSVSHSHVRTKRWWVPNVHKRRFWLPSEKRWVTLTVSTKGLRTIDKKGIEAVVAQIRASPARRSDMPKNEKRPIIKLKSTAGTGYTYVTRKNKTNTRERLELKKYDPEVRQHVAFNEER